MSTVVFISYRREDAQSTANRLHEALSKKTDIKPLLDTSAIHPGANFPESIRRFIRVADVVIVLISRNWMGRQPDGHVRIVDAKDWIHQEVYLPLFLGIPVIPVLVDNAELPKEKELPD